MAWPLNYLYQSFYTEVNGGDVATARWPRTISLRRSRVLHLSTILASFILRTFLVSYSEVLENLGKAFKLVYAKPLRCLA
jgi:hypothetical protein